MSKSKTEKQNKFKFRPLAVVALALCAIVVIYTATTAWLTGTPLNPVRLASLSDFSYDVEFYFDMDGDNEDDGTEVSIADDGAIVLNTDSGSGDYIGYLRCKITQHGSGVAFTRVKITHEFLYTDGEDNVSSLQGDLNMPFVINTDNFTDNRSSDNRSSDNYLYYNGAFPVETPVELISGFNDKSIDFLSITNRINNGENIQLRLNVTVDAVQFNRYKQVWGIDALPQ